MAGDGSYSLAPEELAGVIRDLAECRRFLDEKVADLRSQVRRLHEAWDGLSAEAHVVAQAAIDDGLSTMSEALGDFIRANHDAKSSYETAWDANIALWHSVL